MSKLNLVHIKEEESTKNSLRNMPAGSKSLIYKLRVCNQKTKKISVFEAQFVLKQIKTRWALNVLLLNHPIFHVRE